MGKHEIKTSSSAQGAMALSSAEAEFFALVEAVLRRQGLVALSTGLGITVSRTAVSAATDSSVASSFVG